MSVLEEMDFRTGAPGLSNRRFFSMFAPPFTVTTDCVHHERIWLEKPGPDRVTWQWLAGVNYFCAQGDQRWWHDHRIPGGMGFSVNSVGHLSRSGKIAEVMGKLNAEVGVTTDEFGGGRIRSLEDALAFAMLTIDNASEAVSGRATELLPLDQSEEAKALPACPVKLPPKVAGKNYCTYEGWYHTDYTLPLEYFSQDIERLQTVKRHSLDFTYLFRKHVDNPAFEMMGEGHRIRADVDTVGEGESETKADRMAPKEVLIENCERLQKALSESRNYQ